ncbi:MAG: histidine--tRNA ligase [Candidatus Sumerlaeaceae bacterium]|nr:histidine--tRNA ligase [Candidatus Sumerlaeaceae bacterium]
MTTEGTIEKKSQISAIRGMEDILPALARHYQFVEGQARELFDRYGYGEIRTPVLEPTELFARTVGDSSDIVVSKQMYTFTDPGERSNTMRPEGTAGVVRALIESGLLKETSQQKLFYVGPMFRYEKPQKGRQRQFTQIGMELFGVAHAAADAEVITMCYHLLRRVGFNDIVVKLNNLGDPGDRKGFNDRLREAILEVVASARESGKYAEWCEQWQDLAAINPMRVFDTKVEECRPYLSSLPRVVDYVGEEARNHFDVVTALLAQAGVPFEVDRELVRGLDYYTRTVFEIVQTGLGAQNAILGGGRYDNLVEELGGPPTPAVGMAIGVERLIMAMQAQGIKLPPSPPPAFYVLALDDESLPTAYRLAELARSSGQRVAFDCQPKSAKAGLRSANRSKAQIAVIVGADELSRGVAQWKNLESGEQIELLMAEIERNLKEG